MDEKVSVTFTTTDKALSPAAVRALLKEIDEQLVLGVRRQRVVGPEAPKGEGAMICDVVIAKMPTEEEKKHGKLEEVLFRADSIVARDEKSAAMVAMSQAQKEEKEFDPASAVVFIRPFDRTVR